MIQGILNGINTGASIVALLSFAAAAISWVIGRYRVMDAYPDVARLGDWSSNDQDREHGWSVRVQNIGGTGMAIQSIRFHGCGVSFKPITDVKDTPGNALMPGESLYLYLTDIQDDASVLLQYNTHKDARITHYDRYDLHHLIPEPNLLSAYVAPKMRIRRAMRYKEGQLFHGEGMNSHRRTIKFTPKGDAGFNNAEQWMKEHGYDAMYFGSTGFDDIGAADAKKHDAPPREGECKHQETR